MLELFQRFSSGGGGIGVGSIEQLREVTANEHGNRLMGVLCLVLRRLRNAEKVVLTLINERARILKRIS